MRWKRGAHGVRPERRRRGEQNRRLTGEAGNAAARTIFSRGLIRGLSEGGLSVRQESAIYAAKPTFTGLYGD